MTSDNLQAIISYAREEAIHFQHPYIRSEHLLLALLKIDNTLLPISYAQLSQAVMALLKPTCGAEQKLTLAQGAKRALQHFDNDPTLSRADLAISIVQSSPMLRKMLNELIGDADGTPN